MELSEIRINIDFENLIPKQTAEQFKQLEENVLKDGRVRNPLVVWKDHGVLVDGHHRLRILKAHPEIPYTVIEQEFTDEDAVKEWIITNALGTRNLTEADYTLLVASVYKIRKRRHGGDRGALRDATTGQFTASAQNEHMREKPNRVSEQLAKELGIGKETVKRAEQFADGLESAEKVVPGVTEKVRSGELKAQKGEVRGWRKQTPEEIKKSVKEIEERKSKKSSDRALFDRINNIDALMSGVSTTQYGLGELIREIDALGDAFVLSLSSAIKRRKNVMDSYDDSAEEMGYCIDRIIEKLNEMKKGF